MDVVLVFNVPYGIQCQSIDYCQTICNKPGIWLPTTGFKVHFTNAHIIKTLCELQYLF